MGGCLVAWAGRWPHDITKARAGEFAREEDAVRASDLYQDAKWGGA